MFDKTECRDTARAKLGPLGPSQHDGTRFRPSVGRLCSDRSCIPRRRLPAPRRCIRTALLVACCPRIRGHLEGYLELTRFKSFLVTRWSAPERSDENRTYLLQAVQVNCVYRLRGFQQFVGCIVARLQLYLKSDIVCRLEFPRQPYKRKNSRTLDSFISKRFRVCWRLEAIVRSIAISNAGCVG